MNTKRLVVSSLLAAALAACSSSDKKCQDFCGAGNTCDASGQCVPLACTPACGPGTACQMGSCVTVAALTCTAPYPGCAACDTTPATPVWVGQCGAGTTCQAGSDTCVNVNQLHASLPELQGPFATGYAVTAACVTCHAPSAAEVMASQHWTWAGPTPDLVAADLTTVLNPGTIGKKNLVNNFCVATPSNDKRCDQCHAGYGGDPDPARPQKSARNYTAADSSIPLQNRVDCLVCHSNPAAAYAKDPKNFGNPVATINLAVAAQDIRKPTRSNCGACHFFAGGGDNVKLMGSSLKNPPEAIDVHMGRGMECLECHAQPGHAFRGAGVHVPANTGRAACTDCHDAEPHTGQVPSTGETLDRHTARIGCQTCHIPRFSRGQFAKMDWDWSTAGDNATCGGTPGSCVGGIVTTRVNDDGTRNDASPNAVTSYDYIKGNFVWKKNVAPAYRWSNGKMTHARLSDKLDLGASATVTGTTTADADRITLGEPVGASGNGKIMPFKLMRGRQPFYLDGQNSFAITPNVFGPAGFWGVIQAAGYSFPAYDFDGTGPIAPGQASVDALWGKILATGAVAAGQLTGVTQVAKWDAGSPATPGYAWRYTKLYMDLNHEVAPKAQALGAAATGGCGACHGNASAQIPFCELYGGAPPPALGITCP